MNARTLLAVCLVALLAGASARELQAKKQPTLLSVASGVKELSTLVSVIKAAGLASTLDDPKLAVTVFAPTNAAFAALLKQLKVTSAELLGSKELLKTVLQYHVVPAVATASSLKAGMKIPTQLAGETIVVKSVKPKVVLLSDGGATVTVTKANVAAGKSLVHVVDGVLVPKLN